MGGGVEIPVTDWYNTRKSLEDLFIFFNSIDRTYKLYYGGAQKRPDGMYSKTILDKENQVVALVADSNRKDVRNAVEAAHKAAPG